MSPTATRKPTAAKTAAKAAVPAPAPAAPAAPAFTFGDAEVPAVTRKSTAVNPLLEVCKTIKDSVDEKTKRSTIAKTVNSANAEQTAKIKRWLALAGKELGVTFRSVEKTPGVLTFWAVERIEHKDRKPRNGNGNGNGKK